ncbi:hypothetical protein SAMN05428970_2597 [Agromyces sp. CF514]|uniref:hypothetical protein n=1 Tax=Agromyces sp. CF514 TaxID=1881031 RepID=UPI0008E434EA|nr:hypothetical protein [Agromyces sp. CF514]SFR79629.1 hypothetical protein SAMN05428970_2597 [Agromyces sp. CF514]
MSKLRQDARAFRQRVKMGRTRLWVIVEGVGHDRAFYDDVVHAATQPAVPKYSIRLAESISLDGVSAGGKAHALSLYQYFEKSNALVQENAEVRVAVSFFLDRDDDEFAGSLVKNDHVVYTKHSDVEAEIFANGDAFRAVGNAFGVGRTLVDPIRDATGSPLNALAEVWRDWIRLRLLAIACGAVQGNRFSQGSKINEQQYGVLDQEAAQDLLDAMSRTVADGSWEARVADVDAYLEQVYSRQTEATLVRGKWLAGYLRHLLKTGLPKEQLPANVTDHAIVVACLASIDFGEPWVDHYREGISRILTS